MQSRTLSLASYDLLYTSFDPPISLICTTLYNIVLQWLIDKRGTLIWKSALTCFLEMATIPSISDWKAVFPSDFTGLPAWAYNDRRWNEVWRERSFLGKSLCREHRWTAKKMKCVHWLSFRVNSVLRCPRNRKSVYFFCSNRLLIPHNHDRLPLFTRNRQ